MVKRESWFTLYFIISILLIGCDEYDGQEEEFQEIVENNAILIFKSEIQRTRVSYFPDKNVLLYHFWKKEKFEKNGDLFLHIYPNDKDKLKSNRKKHGFNNISIQKHELITNDSINFYLTKPLPNGIAKIVTGQYIETKRKWSVNYKAPIEEIMELNYYLANSIKRKAVNYSNTNDNFYLQLLFKTIDCVYKNDSENQLVFFSKTSSKVFLIKTNSIKGDVPLFEYGNHKKRPDKTYSFKNKDYPFFIYEAVMPKQLDYINITYEGQDIRINI